MIFFIVIGGKTGMCDKVANTIEKALSGLYLPAEIAREEELSRQRVHEILKRKKIELDYNEILSRRTKQKSEGILEKITGGVPTSQVAMETGFSVQSLYTILRKVGKPVSKMKPQVESAVNVGDLIGLWEILKPPYFVEKTNRRIPVALCRCKGCGVEKEVRYRYLKEGKSCGCQNCRGKEEWRNVKFNKAC